MKNEIEIKEMIQFYEKVLKKQKDNPYPYNFEQSFAEFIEDSISLLEWVLK